MPKTFEKWIEEVKKTMTEHSRSLEGFDEKAWKTYFDEGYSAKEAVMEDIIVA